MLSIVYVVFVFHFIIFFVSAYPGWIEPVSFLSALLPLLLFCECLTCRNQHIYQMFVSKLGFSPLRFLHSY